MASIVLADCRTVNPQNDKMSAEHSHNSEGTLIPISGVCDIAYSYKRQVLTSLDKALFKRISVYGYVSCALHIDESIYLISLMIELAISALAECAYQKPRSLDRTCA